MLVGIKYVLLNFVLVCLLCLQGNFEVYGQAKPLSGLDYLIHPIEEPESHYATLRTYSAEPRLGLERMDSISFSPPSYNNRSILYSLVEPHYLSNEQVEFLSGAIDFPANSSEQTRAELDYLLTLQESRTPELIREVLEIAMVGYWPEIDEVPSHDKYQENQASLFYECKEIIGEECTNEAYPKTSRLLKNIMVDTRLMEYTIKYQLLRPRPYQLENRIEPLQVMTTPSFASGHTLWAYTQAYVWGELIPDRREEFVDLAYRIGESREIMGIHYPSDEEVARQVAHRMLFLMCHNSKFQTDLQEAKLEWR